MKLQVLLFFLLTLSSCNCSHKTYFTVLDFESESTNKCTYRIAQGGPSGPGAQIYIDDDCGKYSVGDTIWLKKMTIPEEINGNNITFNKGDDYCCWNGILMDPKNQLEMFGVNVWESNTDLENGFIMIRGSLDGSDNERIFINGEDYKDCVRKFVDYMIRTHGELGKMSYGGLNDVLLIEPISDTFNIPKIIHFELEFNHHLKLRGFGSK